MPGQENFRIDFNPDQHYGSNVYRHSGNAVAVPIPDTETSEPEEIRQTTFSEWIKSNIALLIIIGVIFASVLGTCIMHNRMVTSNSSYAEVQQEVEQLKRDASAGRQTYSNRLANTDVEAIAEEELGMILSDEQIDISLSQIPR